jgi:hypothetical protein
VNCPEFQKRITAAVDNRLGTGEMAGFLEHASRCLPCRQNYANERSIVTFIHQRVRRVAAPSDVVARILDGLRHEAGAPRVLARAWRAPAVHPALGLTLALLAFFLFVSLPTSRPPALTIVTGTLEGDMILQSVSNYHAVMNGDIVPQFLSDIPERLHVFFQARGEFPVLVPVMKECTLVGGIMNEYEGTPLAHLVYKHGEQTIYLFQACRETVRRGKTLHLSAITWHDLERTGWYCGSTAEGDGIVVWVKDATICTAVSRMSGEHLLAHLAGADGVGEGSPW